MASRFWVGGTGTWDASDTTHWAAGSNGAGGQSVPGSADTVTFDALSGGGTVTVNTTVGVISITMGAFTGALDFSVNNNNVTLSGGGPGFSGTGSGTRTLRLGNGTWTLSSSANATLWDMTTTTNLTFNANSSIISFTGSPIGTAAQAFVGGALTYATLQISAAAAGVITVSGINTFTTLTVVAGVSLLFLANQTITTLNLNGSSGSEIYAASSSVSTQRTITVTTLTATWTAFRALAFSGSGLTATSSSDLRFTSGITITAPATLTGYPASRIQLGM